MAHNGFHLYEFSSARVVLRLDSADLNAFKADVQRIYARYGVTENEIPAHLADAVAAEIHRANETLRLCFYEGDSDG